MQDSKLAGMRYFRLELLTQAAETKIGPEVRRSISNDLGDFQPKPSQGGGGIARTDPLGSSEFFVKAMDIRNVHDTL